MLHGYHLTSFPIWENRIEKEGLVPYPFPRHLIRMKEMAMSWGNTDSIVWLWPTITKFDLVGCVFDRMIAKRSTHIVLLQVEYTKADLIITPDDGNEYTFHHDGYASHISHDGDYDFHLQKPVILLRNRISPKQIKLIGDFDLETLLYSKVALDYFRPRKD